MDIIGEAMEHGVEVEDIKVAVVVMMEVGVYLEVFLMEVGDNFFTLVLIYLLPGDCIYSLEHLEEISVELDLLR